jgi:hypothetical protein
MQFVEPLSIARMLFRRHGAHSVAIARQRSFALRARGDMDRYAVWRRIYDLVCEFRRTGVRSAKQGRA